MRLRPAISDSLAKSGLSFSSVKPGALCSTCPATAANHHHREHRPEDAAQHRRDMPGQRRQVGAGHAHLVGLLDEMRNAWSGPSSTRRHTS